MTSTEFLEVFAPGVIFRLDKKIYIVQNSKILMSQKYSIVTDQMTFVKEKYQMDEFLEQLKFLSENDLIEKENNNNLITKHIVENTQNTPMVNTNVLPLATTQAKPVLEELLTTLVNATEITEDMLKKTNAICNVTKQMIEIGKLEVDVRKLANSI